MNLEPTPRMSDKRIGMFTFGPSAKRWSCPLATYQAF